MPENDLKSKLAAKIQADRAKQSESDDSSRKYKETLLREYPRLCKELLDRVTALVGGIDGVKVDSEMKSETLALTQGSSSSGFKETPVGVVQVPSFVVAVNGRPTIAFTPAGTNILGVHAAIDVSARALPSNTRIFLTTRKDNPETWCLAVRTDQPAFGRWTTELTDEMLSALLERALL